MMRYPAGEQITVPRHVSTRNIRASINAGAFSSERLARVYAARLLSTLHADLTTLGV